MSIETLIEYIINETIIDSYKGPIDISILKNFWIFFKPDIRFNPKDLNEILDLIISIKKIKNQITQSNITLENLKNYYYQIKDVRKKYLSKIIKIKLEDNHLQNLAFYNKNTNQWFERLVYIYLKYEGRLPMSSLHFWKYIKKIFNELDSNSKDHIIYICEDILGGLDLENISRNFESWIMRNIFDKKILKDFYIL
jgi:hypothetical protein